MEIIASETGLIAEPWDSIQAGLMAIGLVAFLIVLILYITRGEGREKLFVKLGTFCLMIMFSSVVVLCLAPKYDTCTIDVGDLGTKYLTHYEILEQKSDHVYVVKLKEENLVKGEEK